MISIFRKKSGTTGAGTPVAPVATSPLSTETRGHNLNGSPEPVNPGHYVAHLGVDGWQFTTPTGRTAGFLSRSHADRVAAISRRQDMEEAYSGITPIAKVLRQYFDARTASPGAGTPVN